MLIKWLIAIIIFIIFFLLLGLKIIFSKDEKNKAKTNRSFCCGKLDKYKNSCDNCKK